LESLPEESGASRWDGTNDSDSDDPLRYPRNFLVPEEDDEGSGNDELGERRHNWDNRARRSTHTGTRRNTLSTRERGEDEEEDEDEDDNGDGDGDGDSAKENDEDDVLDRAGHIGKAALEATSPSRAGGRSKTKGMLLSEDMRGWWVYGSIVGMAVAGIVLGRMPL
jgi:hypothetical protein